MTQFEIREFRIQVLLCGCKYSCFCNKSIILHCFCEEFNLNLDHFVQ